MIWGCALGFWDIARSWILFHLFFQLAVALFSCSMQVWLEMGVHVPTGPHCPDTCKGGGGHCSTGYCLMRDRNSAPCRLIPPYQEKQYQLAPLHTPLHCTAPGDGRVEVHCSAVPPRPWGVGGGGLLNSTNLHSYSAALLPVGQKFSCLFGPSNNNL